MNAFKQQRTRKRTAWSSGSLRAILRALACLIALPGVLPAGTPEPSSLTKESLRAIRFDQKLNQPISLDLVFHDENGARVKLDDSFGGKPVILVLGYYECPMLCSLVFNGMIESLQELKLSVGKDFELVNVSIDPAETPALAAAAKRTFLQRYRRPGAEGGLHFLTGDEAAIAKLADEAGFRYAYDPAIQEYAHPSGFVLLTPEGRVARYFFGVRFKSKDLDSALRETGTNQVGSPIEQFILLCFHYSPLTGKYGELIMGMVRVSGVVTLLGLAASVIIVSRRRRSQLPFSEQPLSGNPTHRRTGKETGP